MVIARYINAARRSFADISATGSLLAGAALIAYGAWQVYRPAGYIVGGVLLIAGVILQARGNA